ncbi:MAG: hypothetical protein KDA61_00990, partial [Planctomycetales bacterium]|nr:hypothetical protein [Planctomycetales bacterium]
YRMDGAEPTTTFDVSQWTLSSPNATDNCATAATLRDYNVHGRNVSYATEMQSEAAKAFRANPHRFNLAQIGLRLLRVDGSRATLRDLKQTRQTVSLWNGEAISDFELDGSPVRVRTAAHPDLDAVAFAIESPLVARGRVGIDVKFAYPAAVWGPGVDEWNQPSRHETHFAAHSGGAVFARTLDDVHYRMILTTDGRVTQRQDGPHAFDIAGVDKSTLQATFQFTPERRVTPAQHDATATAQRQELSYEQVAAASAAHWSSFWTQGGAIDLSLSRDPRWHELERRIVLSQYATAVNCAGSMPPQETGLVCNSWFGKSHLEMHWWHAAHFPLWGRPALLERSMEWYARVQPAARRIAERQGYAGVRWPKMTGPHGVSSPSEVGELLIWQQPHPIYLAELLYRSDPSEDTLRKYRSLVAATADFMASYAHYDDQSQRYELGPILIPAQECYDGRTAPGVMNPAFELAYWRWALRTACAWERRLGAEPPSIWHEVAEQIAPLHVRDGVYTAIANAPFTNRRDHPSMTAALGVLPDVGLVDPDIMRATLLDVERDWQWPDTWGWDYPMLAMTSARLGMMDKAIDFLLLDTPKNGYLANGHCRQADRLPIYLPANGGLLAATAMMAGGWDGCPDVAAPGFPQDGSWTVRSEGIAAAP